eukprot:jgi/Chlat1/7799/Chrsp66S00572
MDHLLPDELWLRILSFDLDARDLCAFSIACRRFCQLAGQDGVWRTLWTREGGGQLNSSGRRGSYREQCIIKYRRNLREHQMRHRREVLRVQSRLMAVWRDTRDLKSRLETELKLQSNLKSELRRVEHLRSVHAVSSVWQPRAVTDRHQRLVQQEPIDPESRAKFLQMELRTSTSMLRQIRNRLNNLSQLSLRLGEELHRLEYSPLKVQRVACEGGGSMSINDQQQQLPSPRDAVTGRHARPCQLQPVPHHT